MERFIYRKSAGVTVLSASFTDFEYKRHCHEEYALGVTLRGIQQYNLDGSSQSSFRDGVMLFNAEQVHDGRARDKSGIDYVMLYIKPELMLEAMGRKEPVRFITPVVYNPALERIILKLADAVLSGQQEALCSELLLALSDRFSGPDIGRSFRKNNALVKTSREIMNESLDRVLKLEELCGRFGLSKFQFIREFKAGTGISPYQYFLNCKLERAKQILEHSRDLYAAVAECGFTDLAHLNRHFKSVYGITAHDYLTQLK